MSRSNGKQVQHQKPVLVLLGEARQSYDFLKEHSHGHDDTEYCFCTTEEQVRDKEASDVVTYGSFWSRRDADDLFKLARTRVR